MTFLVKEREYIIEPTSYKIKEKNKWRLIIIIIIYLFIFCDTRVLKFIFLFFYILKIIKITSWLNKLKNIYYNYEI